MKITTKFILSENETPEYGTVYKKGKNISELEEKIKDKDDEIKYLNEVIDALEEEKEELDDECFKLEDENYSLREEIKELKKENMDLNVKMIAREIKKCITPKIIKASQISMKDCLDAIELMSR